MSDQSSLPEQPSTPDPSGIAKAFSSLGASKGGKARAKALTPEQRSDIARRAVEARWAKKGVAPVPSAAHTGTLKIGDLELDCAVLDDGERVLSQRGFMAALGIKHGGRMTESRVDNDGAVYPLFLAYKNLRPFIDNDLLVVLTNPVRYRHGQGGGLAYGVKAELIPRICNVWLKARDAGVLRHAQLSAATQADILMRGLATVGIIALVDEATGYQDDRARDALAKILERFVAKELQPYLRMFPAEYFKGLCKLKGKPWPLEGNKMPRYFGKITNDIVYSRLAPGLLKRLNEKNPPDERGYRRNKNTQWLTDDIGRPKLLEHLAVVTAFMQVAEPEDYEGFLKLLDRARPRQIEVPLFEKKDNDDGLLATT